MLMLFSQCLDSPISRFYLEFKKIPLPLANHNREILPPVYNHTMWNHFIFGKEHKDRELPKPADHTLVNWLTSWKWNTPIGLLFKRMPPQCIRTLSKCYNLIWALLSFQGTPVLGSDGAPLIVQPAYQQTMVKPGHGASYMPQQQQQQQQQQQPQQPSPSQQQQGPSGQQQTSPPGQMVIPQQYVGMQQPLYIMSQPGRTQFAPQQTVRFTVQLLDRYLARLWWMKIYRGWERKGRE